MTRTKPKWRTVPHVACTIEIKTNKTGQIQSKDLAEAIDRLHNALYTIYKYAPKLARPISIRILRKPARIQAYWEGSLWEADRLNRVNSDLHRFEAQKEYE